MQEMRPQNLPKLFYIEVTEPIKTVFLQYIGLAGAINQLFLWRIFMKWCSAEETYLNYLRSYEKRIPYSDYGENHFKPFFQPLFQVKNGIVFVSAISHAQRRHHYMKNMTDFRKTFIDVKQRDGKTKKHLAGVVHLNYMFPAPQQTLKYVTPQNIQSFRSFANEVQKSKYIDLLNKELFTINSIVLIYKPRPRNCMNEKEIILVTGLVKGV